MEEKWVVIQDKFDERTYRELLEQAPRLKKCEEQGEESKLDGWRHVQQDVWASLFKADPKKLDPVPEHLSLGAEVLAQAENCAEWRNLRENCKLDEFSAAIGTIAVAEKLAVPEEAAKAHQTVQHLMERITSLRDRADTYKEIAEGGGKRGSVAAKKSRALADKAEEYEAMLPEAVKALKDAAKAASDGIRQSLRVAASEANRDIERAKTYCEVYGSEPGQLQHLPLREKLLLASRIKDSPKLAAIAEKAGRFQRLALHKRETRTKHGVDEIVDIECGSNLGKVLPSELALLADDVTEDYFIKKLAEGQLLQYKMEGAEKAGKGPIVVCLDNSGSMQGDKETWAKAFALGLLQIAKKEGRDFAVINFSGRGSCRVHLNIIGPALEEFLGGGTDFEEPIEQAIKVISGDDYYNMTTKAFEKADIVLVTDGECSVSDNWLRWFRQMKDLRGFALFGVSIMCYNTATLDKLTDEPAVRIEDIARDAAAVEIYGKV